MLNSIPTIVSCSTLGIGLYLFYRKKVTPKFKPRETNDWSPYSFMRKWWFTSLAHTARAKWGWELTRVDSHESFCQLSSTIINSGRKRTRVRQTLIDSHEKIEHIQIRWESMRVREFELSSTLILVWPGLTEIKRSIFNARALNTVKLCAVIMRNAIHMYSFSFIVANNSTAPDEVSCPELPACRYFQKLCWSTEHSLYDFVIKHCHKSCKLCR